MNFTPQQQEAISKNGKNILLSAAAGSGKTAVLVQRVINRILDPQNPVSVSDLLILTFTDAAAREMKKKISDAINREFSKNPQNAHLKKQRILMPSANISTVHSFCLEIIKGNINKTDIPMNFSIISEVDNKILKEKALDLVLSRFYEKIDMIPSFKRLALCYGSDKGDKNLREILEGVMNFSLSMPRPSMWLTDAHRLYKFKNFEDSLWYSHLFDYCRKICLRTISVYDEIIQKADENLPSDHPYAEFFKAERQKFLNLDESLSQKDYNLTYTLLRNLKFDRIPSCRKSDSEECLAQDNIKAFRELAKKQHKKLSEIFAFDKETAAAQLSETESVVRTFKNIVLMSLRLYKKMKRLQNYLDFNDLEHELIEILSDKKGNPTETAFNLRNKFSEILVDEYQDTNYIQEEMFRLISRDDGNVFMVGDIKQSIYKFRNAVPELFTEKFHRYQNSSDGFLIRLNKNFRSRGEVLDFVNFVFDRIMTVNVGGVDYKSGEQLIVGADYKPSENPNDYETEIHITDASDSGETAYSEAESIARRIRHLVDTDKINITDKDGTLRPVSYRDIVILMRNTKKTAPVFEEVFEKHNIPIYSESGKSYLTSIEVRTILSFLQIIDNPLQDIPLIAVLRSPMWRFTPDMLAKIRANRRSGTFFDAVCELANQGDISCARFVSELDYLRRKSKTICVAELIMTICTRYNYNANVLGMDNGEWRNENLRLLFERAAEFDTSNGGGLFNFMLYIQTLLETDNDLTPAKLAGENSDTVRIMSIHKSKGLEFPVVILANSFGEFNETDLRKNILFHDRLGFGFKYVDAEKRISYPSIPHKIISGVSREELAAEEMRLLYVALTRAKEKLMIFASVSARTSAWPAPYLAQDTVSEAGILNARAIGDWVIYALARREEWDEIYDKFKIHYKPDAASKKIPLSIHFHTYSESEANEEKTVVSEELDKNVYLAQDIIKKLEHPYKYRQNAEIPLKISVSEAKRMTSSNEVYIPNILSYPRVSPSQTELISGTERGTVTHFVLQHTDPQNTDSEEAIKAQINKMTETGIISLAQANSVNPSEIFSFFSSALGKRMKNAKKLYREFNFYNEADASDFYPESQEGTKILLQGTIDCFFEEDNGNIVILDYKTDRISKDELLSRSKSYYPQLKYYKKGLEDILGKTVSEAYLYFLHLAQDVSIAEAKP